MASLLDGVKGMMTDALVNKVAGMVGIESKMATSAIKMFLPAVIGGLINKGSSESGAGNLLDLFKKGGFGSSNNEDLGAVIADKSKADSWLETGSDLLGNIFGNKQSGILDGLLKSTGLNKAGGSMLLKFIAPIVVNKLAGMVFKNGWGAKKLSSYLGEQKASIAGIPGLAGMLGASDSAKEAVVSTASTVAAGVSKSNDDREPSGGGGWWKWLLPLLIGAGLIWFLTKDGCGDTTKTDGDNIEMTDNNSSTNATEINGGPKVEDKATMNNSGDAGMEIKSGDGNNGTSAGMVDYSKVKINDDGSISDASGKVIHAAGSYALDSNGNLIGNAGNILVKAAAIPATFLEMIKGYLGKYAGVKLSLDDNGNLIDGTGKIVYKNGEFTQKNGFYYDSAGNKLGRIWSKIVKAVTDAAGATVDAMKGIFTDLITKKEGAKTNYSLSNIEWKKENNRIANYSKAEVEGLAAAMKATDSGKIVVNVYTNDGKDDKENKNLSKTRAEVVHNMLVALGVPDGRISFKGMGTGDNKVEIGTK